MKKTLILMLFLSTQICAAQDHIYSQFYNSPVYLNPALNGQFEGDLRMNLIYRNQWTSIPGQLNYYTFSMDYHVPKFGGGFGAMITKSSEGTAYLNKTNFSGIYSYSVDFENSTLSFGLQAGVTNRKIDSEKLLFLDQIDARGIIAGGATGASALQFNNKFFFDAGGGINYVQGNFMIGASGQHLNQPNESFTGTKSPLPVRLNAHISYKLPLDFYGDEDAPSVIPSVVVYNQAKIRSYSVGAQYKNRSVNLGLWYRTEGSQQDAFVVSLIFDLFVKRDYDDKLRLGLSHDATTSKLPYSNTSGTTEGALSYETTVGRGGNGGRSSKNPNGTKCYDFY